MKIITVGASQEEQGHAIGKFLPYAPGKGPGKFVSAGEKVTLVGGEVSKGVSQGAGIGVGLIGVGALWSWLKHHFKPSRRRA